MMQSFQFGTLRSQLGGLAMPLGILVIMAMMIVPLPSALLDVFFVGNIVLSLLVLMVAVNTQKPLDFSSFPSILLIATTLRLALNVASTRVVLAEGHTGPAAAGHVIEAFANFVVGGNFFVGLLVFIILVIINMVVIAKGAGRVSEVSARFTLDAMPGKQMAIDADLNAGLLTSEQARLRREEVGAEANFYGSMDGASKFVKGDAVAGLIILGINVVGGIIIGVFSHSLSLGVAADTYVRLSVGDGLVAQVPGLLLSLAAAIIVTRSSGSSDMGGLIGKQMHLARAWGPAAVVLLILGVVPGMPNTIFLIAGALSGLAAFFAHRGAGTEVEPAAAAPAAAQPGGAGTAGERADRSTEAAPAPITAEEVTDLAPLSLQIGYGLIPLASGREGGNLVARITAIRRELSRALGIVVPGVRIRDDLTLPPNAYRLRIGQTIVAENVVHAERKLAIPGHSTNRKLAGIEVKDPSFGLDAIWILPHQQAEAEAEDYTVVDPEAVVATHLGQVLQQHAGDLIGPDDVQSLLDALAAAAPTLVQTVVPKLVPLHVLTAVMRQLLSDRVPVSDLRRILEGLAQFSGSNASIAVQAEALRPMLAPLLLQQIVPIGAKLDLVTLSPDLEQLLLRTRRQGEDGLTLDPGFSATLLRDLGKAQDEAQARGVPLMVVVTPALRRSFAAFVRPHLPDALVLGLTDIPETRRIEVTRSIGLPAALPPGDNRTNGG